MSGSEQIWMNLIESDWDWVSLDASDARHQARQAKPHPSHQSPIQPWLGLSVQAAARDHETFLNDSAEDKAVKEKEARHKVP